MFPENTVVTDILRTMTVHAEKGKSFAKARRESYGLSLCISGQITYTAGGCQYVSAPGYAVLLPKGAAYSLLADKPGLFPLINFDCMDPMPDTITVLSLADPAGCLADFQRIHRLFLNGGSRLEIFSSFYSLLHKLQLHSPQLLPAVEYIDKNLRDPALSNEALARQLHISEGYLRKLFRSHYGTTPKQYILDKRLEKARQLLLDTSMSVTAVAEESGFSSVYHFCRAFREKTGSTPTEYAKRNRSYRL